MLHHPPRVEVCRRRRRGESAFQTSMDALKESPPQQQKATAAISSLWSEGGGGDFFFVVRRRAVTTRRLSSKNRRRQPYDYLRRASVICAICRKKERIRRQQTLIKANEQPKVQPTEIQPSYLLTTL